MQKLILPILLLFHNYFYLLLKFDKMDIFAFFVICLLNFSAFTRTQLSGGDLAVNAYISFYKKNTEIAHFVILPL